MIINFIAFLSSARDPDFLNGKYHNFFETEFSFLLAQLLLVFLVCFDFFHVYCCPIQFMTIPTRVIAALMKLFFSSRILVMVITYMVAQFMAVQTQTCGR